MHFISLGFTENKPFRVNSYLRNDLFNIPVTKMKF